MHSIMFVAIIKLCVLSQDASLAKTEIKTVLNFKTCYLISAAEKDVNLAFSSN